MKWTVSSDITADVVAPAEIVLQVAVARRPGLTIDEKLIITQDGRELTPRLAEAEVGTQMAIVDAAKGALQVSYRAEVEGEGERSPDVVEPEKSVYTRPSRYVDADRLYGYAKTEFGHVEGDQARVRAVRDWVAGRLTYTPGASRPVDGAIDTLGLGEGVCRDYAHLSLAMLRALHIPARMVAVYAPGCDPMDFHAVVEALVDDRWQLIDATALAPRQSLLRIATGRDAADIAFFEDRRGIATIKTTKIAAVVDGDLPTDDEQTVVELS